MEEFEGNKHYIRLDEHNNIIKGLSDAFEQSQEGDVCINEQGGRHFSLFGTTNPSIVNDQGIYLYKYINGEVVVKTEQEIQTETESLPPPSKSEIETLRELVDLLIIEVLEGEV